MDDKISKMKKIVADTDYLKDEYGKVKMWGECPDGDLKFEKLMEWLSSEDNVYMMEFMIKVSKEINQLTTEG
jgi:hypothetical protein